MAQNRRVSDGLSVELIRAEPYKFCTSSCPAEALVVSIARQRYLKTRPVPTTTIYIDTSTIAREVIRAAFEYLALAAIASYIATRFFTSLLTARSKGHKKGLDVFAT